MSIVPRTSTQNLRTAVSRRRFAMLFTISVAVALGGYGVFTDRTATDGPGKETHFGACMLREPARTAPDSFSQSPSIVETTDYPPFTKALTVNGLTLVADDSVPDAFLELVAQSTREMFSQDSVSSASIHTAVFTALHDYRAVLPVVSQEQIEKLFAGRNSDIEALRNRNSVCDIIVFQSDGQVMEVIEHILHAVSVIGLHHALPDEWGISTDSALYRHMQVAIEKGYFDPESYERDIVDSDTYLRVVMQEFGYWAITTAWDFQEPYGAGEGEWSIRTPEELATLLPDLNTMIKETIGQFMTAPSDTTLAEIKGPF